MRITQEADYALRIVSLLAQKGLLGAPEMSENVKVPQGFAMKILRKLTSEGIIRSKRGVNGGYTLSRSSEELTVYDGLYEIAVSMDGEGIVVNRQPTVGAPNNPDKSRCRYHNVFASVNEIIKERLSRLTIKMMVDANIPTEELIKIINN